MKQRYAYQYLLILLSLLGASVGARAQAITTGALSASAVCAGSSLTVPFSTTGTFGRGNVFAAQLSDATGTFGTSPTVIGTLTNSPASGTVVTNSSLAATIGAGIPAGSAYKVRVVSTTFDIVGTTSPTTLMVNPVPGLPDVANPAPYCENSAAQPLSATAAAGATLNWFQNGKPIAGAPTPSTSQAGTTIYSVSQTLNGCTGGAASITVTVNNRPGPPGVTSPQSACQGDTPRQLTATLRDGGTSLNWYAAPTGGVGASVAPTPPTSATGTTTYYVSQSQGSCESDRVLIEFRVIGKPDAPAVTTPAPYCQGATTGRLSATAAPGATLLWYGTSATGGTPSTTAPFPGSQSSATYYVSQSINYISAGAVGCESVRSPISVTVIATPAPPKFTQPAAFCQGTTAPVLSATADAGNTLLWWGTAQSGGTASPNPPAVNNQTSATYYVSQVTPEGCSSARQAISVTVTPTPGAPTGLTQASFCQNRASRKLTVTAAAGATLNWFDANGADLPDAPTPPTSATGTFTYRVSQTVNGCTSTTANVSATVNAIPVPPQFTTPRAYCQGETAAPLSATGTSLLWYQTSNGSGSAQAIAPNTGQAGTINYYVTQTVNGCESDQQVIPVQIKTTPPAPTVQTISFCQNTTAPALSAGAVSGATLNWYGTSPTSGTASASPPTVPADVATTYTYYVSQTLNGCESGLGQASGRSALLVRVNPTPTAPGVSPVSFCNNAPATALTANGTNLTWYDAGDNRLGNPPTPGTGTVGDQTYKVTQTSSDGCVSPKASLVVTIKPLPPAPTVSNLTYCQTQPDQPAQNVQPLTAGGENIQWYYPDGTPTSAPTPPIDRAQVITYSATQTVNGCTGNRASLQVTVQTTPAPTVAKSLVTYCRDQNATPLEATATPGGTLFWVDPYNNVTQQAPTPYTLNTTPAGGANFYVYQRGANGCYSARSAIKLIVTTVPTLSLSGSTTVSLGQTVPLRLTFTSDPPYSYSITGGYAGVANRSDTIINVLPRGNTTYQVLGVSNGCGTGLPGNPATATVTVLVPTITTNALASTTLCAGTSFTVPFTTTGTFTAGNQFQADLISVSDTTKKFTNLSVASGNANAPLVINLPATQPGGQYYVRVRASNPGVALTGTNSPTTLTIRALPTATLTGTQNTYQGSPANLTLTLGGDGPWTVTYADSVRSYSAVATSSPYVVEVRPSRTTTYRLTDVSNGCGTGTLSGTAVVTVLPLLGLEDQALSPLVNAYPVPTGATLTVTIDVPLLREPATLTLSDLRGQSVLQQTTRARQTDLDLSRQPAGTYLLHIQVGDRQATRKVLKL